MAMFIYQVASPRKPQAHVVIYREELCGNLIVEAAVIQEVFACFSISAPTGGCLARVAPPNRCSGTHPLPTFLPSSMPVRQSASPSSRASVVARSCLPDSLPPPPTLSPVLVPSLTCPRASTNIVGPLLSTGATIYHKYY